MYIIIQRIVIICVFFCTVCAVISINFIHMKIGRIVYDTPDNNINECVGKL